MPNDSVENIVPPGPKRADSHLAGGVNPRKKSQNKPSPVGGESKKEHFYSAMSNHIKWLYLLILLPLPLCAAAQYDPNTVTPDNAADWYQKAFDLYEDPNGFDLTEYATGDIELTPQIEQYLISQQPVIDLLKKAAQIEHCDWQFDPLADGVYSMPPYLVKAKKAEYLLLANGIYQEIRGSRMDINSLFTPILKLASHIDSPDIINHLVALSSRTLAYNEILRYINRHHDCRPSDLYRMESIICNDNKSQKISSAESLNGEIEFQTRILTHHKVYLDKDKDWTEIWAVPVDKLSEDFYHRNLVYYRNYMKKIQLCLQQPYTQAFSNIQELEKTFNKEILEYLPEISGVIENRSESYKGHVLTDVEVEKIEQCDLLYTLFSTNSGFLMSMLSIDTKTRTNLNALEAGIKLLIRYRTTKQIPENLPFNSPKDLFSDKPFLIIKTVDGFKLKCQGEDLSRSQIKKKTEELDIKLPDGISFDNVIYEYEFKLPKN